MEDFISQPSSAKNGRIYQVLKNSNPRELLALLVFFVGCMLSVVSLLLGTPPNNFPIQKTVEIERGATLSEIAEKLKTENIIKSEFWFKVLVVLGEGSRGVVAGDYYFKKPIPAFGVAQRVASGEYGLEQVRVTIPEGWSVFQIAESLADKFSLFDVQKFVEEAPEGHLFPDTYFFLPNATTEEVIGKLTRTFEDKTVFLQGEAKAQGKVWEEVVIIASIVEKEAHKTEDRFLISGVIHNRLDIGMPLQVDATFAYVNGKNTYTLTKEDLTADSPYNTYLHAGLPPTPIANPGLESLEAALYPAETDALYFLSDLSGNTYYAETFEEHQVNREKYLRK